MFNNKERTYIQNWRGIAIILVVGIHSFILTDNLSINNVIIVGLRNITNISVSIFVFISAFVTNYSQCCNKWTSYYKSRILRLFVPLLVWTIIYWLINLVFKNNTESFNVALNTIFFSSPFNFHLYYLFVLLQLVAITPLLYFICKKNNIIFDTIILLITPSWLFLNDVWFHYTSASIPFCNLICTCFLSFYYFGMMARCRNYKSKFNINNYFLVIIFIVVLLFACLISIDAYINRGNIQHWTTQLKIVNFFPCAVIAVIIVNNISRKKLKLNNLLTILGDNSYGIYLSHVLFLVPIKTFVLQCLQNSNLLIIESFFIWVTTLITSLIFTILVCKFIGKKAGKIIGFK